jgi:hypothetical protein
MITTSDINKLKTVFVTKDYLKKELSNYHTKDDLKKELSNYPTKEDAKNYATKDDVQDIIGGIHTIIEMLGEEKIKNKDKTFSSN